MPLNQPKSLLNVLMDTVLLDWQMLTYVAMLQVLW